MYVYSKGAYFKTRMVSKRYEEVKKHFSDYRSLNSIPVRLRKSSNLFWLYRIQKVLASFRTFRSLVKVLIFVVILFPFSVLFPDAINGVLSELSYLFILLK